MSELLARDPRTAWAWQEYLETEQPLEVSEALATQLIEAIPLGDHVEVFAEGKILRGKKAKQDDGLRGKKGHLVARTVRRWILVRDDLETAEVLDAPAVGLSTQGSAFMNKRHIWCTNYDKAKVKLFVDDYEGVEVLRLCGGVGHEIGVLPSWDEGGEPEAPYLGVSPPSAGDHAVQRGLTTDWKVAEEVALDHMKVLGFHDSRLTGGGRDKGVDIVHAQAAAQVKMQGVPVSAPLVQQLRGARPELPHHLFFSTSGYTAAAEQEAASSGVGLFRISSMGAVTPVGSIAGTLEMDAAKRRSGPEGHVAQYADHVRKRVKKALHEHESMDKERQPRRDQRSTTDLDRVLAYLMAAQHRIRTAPQIGSMSAQAILDYYTHADRLAGVFLREMRFASHPDALARLP